MRADTDQARLGALTQNTETLSISSPPEVTASRRNTSRRNKRGMKIFSVPAPENLILLQSLAKDLRPGTILKFI